MQIAFYLDSFILVMFHGVDDLFQQDNAISSLFIGKAIPEKLSFRVR